MNGAPVFPAPHNAALAGLIFELASQLHVERSRRQALEAVLAGKGIVSTEEIEGAAENSGYRQAVEAALDQSIRKLLLVLSEGTDARTPLRAEVPKGSSGDR
jgi:hypothetical protein